MTSPAPAQTAGLPPTTVRLVALEARHMTTIGNMAGPNREGVPYVPSPDEIAELCRQIYSDNLLDLFNTNASAALRLQVAHNDYKRLETEAAEEVASLNDKLSKRRKEVTRLTKSLDLAHAAAPPAGDSSASKGASKHQDMETPKKFSGDKSKYRIFKSQLQNKLVGDKHKFTDEQHKMLFVTSLLDENAYKMVLPFIDKGVVDLACVDELWDVLDGAYEDPDKAGTAERELENLKQGNREFSVYFADFQRLMAELRWDTPAKRAALYRGMSDDLKDYLMNYEVPSEWPAFTQLLQRLDSRMRQRMAEKKSVPKPSSHAPARNPPARSPVVPVSERTTSNLNYHGPAPMDLSAAGRDAEKQRVYLERRAAGLCTACGNAGHFRQDCPRRRNPVRANEAALAPAEAEAPAPAQSGNV